ncbi:MAG: PAS domain-containing protein [Alphaproteobacteria bacterium]|nr:PAS domain-containing protein [Alphaproteobacteria bacterium]
MELSGQGATPQGQPSIEFITDPSRIRDANVRHFLELWQAAHVDGRAPGKSFLDPLRLRFLLGSLSLLEVQREEPLRFRYRLVGTDIVQRLGHELTGKFLDEHPDPLLRPFLVKGATMVHHRTMPAYAHVQARTLGQDWLLEVVAVPLLGPDGEVAFIGAGQSFPPDKTEQPGRT